MMDQAASERETSRSPFHAWVVSADFMFVLLERVTILAAVYAVAMLTKSTPVFFIYSITLAALLFSTNAALFKIAHEEGLFKSRGYEKLIGMVVVMLITIAVAFGVPKIVVMLADSVGSDRATCTSTAT